MSEKKSRFVQLCQHVLACAVVVLVTAPAVGVARLDLVGPPAADDPTAPEATARSGGSLVAAEPVLPEVTEIPLTTQTPRAGGRDRDKPLTRNATGLRLPAREADGQAAVSVPEPVEGYATVGVTWAPGQEYDDDEITISVRSLEDGEWSAWQELRYDADHGPDPGSPEAARERLGTDAVVVGDVDDVQVKAVTPDGSLPSDLRLAVVDPGKEEALTREAPAIDTSKLPSSDLAPMSATTAGSGATTSDGSDPVAPAEPIDPNEPADPTDPSEPAEVELAGAPADVTPKPQIFSRAQWGADERLRDKGSLRYFEVHGGFVHHTVNANNYTRAQVPSIIRGIYAYHTQSKGWSDIGYNFLVDRFGRIWEGRYGGVDRPVVGAHTLNYNDYSFAMSAIGNYESARPSSAVLDAYGRLFAWKLSLHGVDAGSRSQRIGPSTLPAINGHRDVGQTACPGRYLYAQVGAIRTLADRYQHPFGPRQRSANVSGTSWPDLVVRNRATHRLSVVRTGGQVGLASGVDGRVALPGDSVSAVSPDLDGDGKADLLVYSPTADVTSLRPGDGAGHFGAATRSISRLRGVDQLVAIGDLNGDGRNDVVARTAETKRLLWYPGNGGGGVARARSLSSDWSRYNLTAPAGDFNRDGVPDLLARDVDGALWWFRGARPGSLASPTAIPGAWNAYPAIAGGGDLTNDGRPDVVVRARSGAAYVFPGTGTGGLQYRYGPLPGLSNVVRLWSPGQVAGRGHHDLVGQTTSGRLVTLPNKGTKNVAAVMATQQVLHNTDLLLNVGDWNGDGRADLMTRRASDGAMLFRAGDGRDHWAAPVVAGTGWGAVTLVAAVGDLTGDGRPDLLGQPSRGGMRIYPGNGVSGFRSSFAAFGRVSATAQVGAGLWDGDGSPDSILRRSDGTLWLHPGNGPGGLTAGRQVGSGAQRYDWLVGAGDANGDRRPDVLGRTSDGALWLLPGATGGGFGTPWHVGVGFQGYDLAG